MAGEWDSVPEDERVWEYEPNRGAAIVFTIFWFVTVFVHIIQMLKTRKWYLSVLIIGGTWELTGFIFRVISCYYPLEVKYYAPSLSLIVLAPVVIIAFYYMTIGRLILVFIPTKRVFRIPAHRITAIFLAGDIISFLVQMAGTNFLVNDEATPNEIKIGQNILMAGLALQTLVFLLFIVLTIRFEHNYKRAFGGDPDYEIGKERWRKFMRVINVCCGCIVIRSIFRLAEFAMDYPGPLVKHEVAFYLLEAVPMLPCSYLFHWYHPSTVLVGDESSFRVARRERKRRKKEEKELEIAGKADEENTERRKSRSRSRRASRAQEAQVEMVRSGRSRRASLGV